MPEEHVVHVDPFRPLGEEPGTGHNRWHEAIEPVAEGQAPPAGSRGRFVLLRRRRRQPDIDVEAPLPTEAEGAQA